MKFYKWLLRKQQMVSGGLLFLPHPVERHWREFAKTVIPMDVGVFKKYFFVTLFFSCFMCGLYGAQNKIEINVNVAGYCHPVVFTRCH